MRKTLLLVVFTMVISLVFSTAAVAHQPGKVVVHGNSQSGSVSFGDHGYAWYHSNPGDGSPVSSKINQHYKDWGAKHLFKRLSDKNAERYFYVDDNGVSHYFYLDPDREYDVVVYQDKNGTTQYSFKATGWK